MYTKYELADIISQFGRKFLKNEKLSPVQLKALFDIVQCRTSSLGGHQEACDCCGTIRYSYNSCGNRHCPKCLLSKQIKWAENLKQKVLPVKHYHIVFTLPHCLNNITIWDAGLYYKLLFKTVWQVLYYFGYTHYGVETGAVMILHTWGQNLSLHPHLHCLVPAAGYTLNGKWKNIGKNGLYLYPVYQLSQNFKHLFLANLKCQLKKTNKLEGFNSIIQKAYSKKWVVYCEPALGSSEHVIRYLGRYTHRVAISNQNIVNITKNHVEFIAKDYRDNAKKKAVRLKGEEFLRRFIQHILPKRFIKIRHYGIYNSTIKRNLNLEFPKPDIEQLIIKKETAIECINRVLGIDIKKCPVCKNGVMLKIKEIPRIRSPNNHLPGLLANLLK